MFEIDDLNVEEEDYEEEEFVEDSIPILQDLPISLVNRCLYDPINDD